MTRQKLPKVLAILGGCLLGGGIVLAGAGFVAMGCNLDTYTGGNEAPQPLTASYSPGAVTAVKVDASVGDVAVIGTEAGSDLDGTGGRRGLEVVPDLEFLGEPGGRRDHPGALGHAPLL